MSELKMSDVFELPVSKLKTSRLIRDQSGQVINNLPNGNEAAMRAINSHDTLVAENERLKGLVAQYEEDLILLSPTGAP